MNGSLKWVMAGIFGMMLLGSNAYAQGFKGDGDEGQGMRAKMEERTNKIFDQLNLSEEQQKLLKENREKNKASGEGMHKALKENMKAMGEELKKKDYDIAKVKAIQAESKRMQNEMADRRLDAILEVRKILTPEQFQKFSEMMEQERMNKREHPEGSEK